jgi:hypothetical protein
MRHVHRTTLAALLALLLAGPASSAQAGDAAAPFADVPFKGRVKFHQAFERVLKISVEPEVMPLDTESLTAVLNGPAVAGAAARETYGLSLDEYATYVSIKASTSNKPGAVIARIIVSFRADGRVPAPAVDAFVENVRKRLQLVLEESINIDRRNLAKRQDILIERKGYLEKKYVEVWTNRVRVAEDAGLAEHSIEGKRGVIGALEADLMDVEMEMVVRQSRIEHTKKELEATRSAGSPGQTPRSDPLADELEKLVRARARQLEAANNAGADEDARDAAETRMLEAKLRWIERLAELEKLKPEERLKALDRDMTELEARKEHLLKTIATAIEQARSLYRYTEHVELLKKKEVLLDKAIERIEQQVDELGNYSDKLGTITVSIIGQDAAK